MVKIVSDLKDSIEMVGFAASHFVASGMDAKVAHLDMILKHFCMMKEITERFGQEMTDDLAERANERANRMAKVMKDE